MINKVKFSKLKKITKYFRIADELKRVRDLYTGSFVFDLQDLALFREYLADDPDALYIKEIDEILNGSDPEAKFESIHILYLKIKNDFGYPVPDTEFEITGSDSLKPKRESTKAVVILENLRSAFNTGSIIRTCECFGAEKLILYGITPGIDNMRTIKTAKGAHEHLNIERSSSVENTVNELKISGYVIIGAETGKGSTDLRNCKFINRTALIFGNEEIGLSRKTIDLCDQIVSIEMRGTKNSLNVSNAVSVFLFEYSRQYS
ncbi:MAG TPA: TrmH family RNA methyltransferase [Clostridiales bacterium]|nr:TrmH family RNA methyltransferase [Clostridiales bacterium]HQP70732.1 TrmH family RNA methyltransferase [Clostridiales bacterium]